MNPNLVFFVCFCLLLQTWASFDVHLDRKANPVASHRPIETKRWTVELKEGSDPEEIAQRHGFVNKGRLPFDAGNHFVFEEDREDFLHLHHSEEVLWTEKQLAKWRYKREVVALQKRKRGKRNQAASKQSFLSWLFDEDVKFPDPLFPKQWHLHGTPGIDLNVLPVWKQNITGKGVGIAVVDDGVDGTHPDLKDNYDPEASFDFNDNKPVPEPMPKDHFNSHGTSAGAVAAAGINSYCGIGIAPGARISGIRMVAAPVTDHDEALALTFKNQRNSIYTSSWGPTDDGNRLEGPSRLASLGMIDSIKNGRGGLGTIFIWAVGNGGMRGDNCNYDGFASNRYALSIGSINHSGTHCEYSEHCAALDAVTPSSGHSRGIVTTTLKELEGGCTSRFGGTSASSPLAAGVVALILEANPKLTWRDVQGVIHLSSKLVDDYDEDWQVNGAGIAINHKYGFGAMDAARAVDLAKKWVNYPPELPPVDSGRIYVRHAIPAAGPENPHTGVLFTHNVHSDIVVLHTEVIVNVTVIHRGKLQIRLVSPSNTYSLLNTLHGDKHPHIIDWKYTTKRNWHERSKGVWKIVVENTDTKHEAFLHYWQLRIYGHAPHKK